MRLLFLLIPFYVVLTGCLPSSHRFVVAIETSSPPALKEGEVPVFLGEEEVGKVVAVERGEGELRLVVEVKREARARITQQSRFLLRQEGERWRLLIEPRPGEPVRFGQVVHGELKEEGLFERFLRQLQEGLRPLREEFRRFREEVERLPESPRFQELRREMEQLARELKEAEEEAREELLPKLQRELERLRRELEELQEEEEAPSVETI